MNAYLAAPAAIRRRPSEESSDERPGAGQRVKTPAEKSLQRVLQTEAGATPAPETRPQYHTGRMPNSKLGDNKPRLLLMGQKRWACSFSEDNEA